MWSQEESVTTPVLPDTRLRRRWRSRTSGPVVNARATADRRRKRRRRLTGAPARAAYVRARDV